MTIGLSCEVTEHTIHRDWCPRCKKKVEPAVTEALPNATLGNRVLVLSAWLHYGLGTTLAQLVDVFNFHLVLKVTPGGLMQMWHRLAQLLRPWYEAIREQALDSAVLNADETGWRVNGKTHWLWCFATGTLSYFMIDRSRGSPALLKFLTQEFALFRDKVSEDMKTKIERAQDLLDLSLLQNELYYFITAVLNEVDSWVNRP